MEAKDARTGKMDEMLQVPCPLLGMKRPPV